jgi:PDZ domain-containing protein
VTVQAPLIPPAKPGTSPHLGITIESAGMTYKLPFPVKIEPQKIVGGPSAGLMFTLTLYNRLTPDDLTGGRKIAGTGTINLDGTVGPIGGVEQKVAAAEAAGAEYFLSPPENYAAAAAVARTIKVFQVDTAEQAVAFLKSLPPRPAQ